MVECIWLGTTVCAFNVAICAQLGSFYETEFKPLKRIIYLDIIALEHQDFYYKFMGQLPIHLESVNKFESDKMSKG